MEILSSIIALLKSSISCLINAVQSKKQAKKLSQLIYNEISRAYFDLQKIQNNFLKLNDEKLFFGEISFRKREIYKQLDLSSTSLSVEKIENIRECHSYIHNLLKLCDQYKKSFEDFRQVFRAAGLSADGIEEYDPNSPGVVVYKKPKDAYKSALSDMQKLKKGFEKTLPLIKSTLEKLKDS